MNHQVISQTNLQDTKVRVILVDAGKSFQRYYAQILVGDKVQSGYQYKTLSNAQKKYSQLVTAFVGRA
jgi:hypothetical protein